MKALYALALVAGIAQAQSGVALTSPAPPDARTEAKKQEPGVAAVYPVKVNPSALDTTVITMQVEGRDYRFTGKLQPAQGTSMENGKEKPNTVELWQGSDGTNTAILTREGNSVYGALYVNGQNFTLYNFALVKTQALPERTKKAKP
jgi:hypothetical protein